jgi:hypothetical protein
MIKRREFLRTGLLAAGAAGHPASFAFSRAVDSASADSRIDLLLTPVGHVLIHAHNTFAPASVSKLWGFLSVTTNLSR